MRRLPHCFRRVALLLGTIAAPFATPLTGQTVSIGDAVDAALGSHPALAAAASRVASAQETGEAARAAWLPGASVSASLTQFQKPMLSSPIHSFRPSAIPDFDRSLVQGRLGMEYLLFDGGARSSRIRAADALHEASGFALDGAQMQVIEETLTAYVGVLSARAVLEASRAQLAALEEEHARASRELAAGTAPEVEVLRAAATLQEARADEASARARVGLAERALGRLMGADSSVVTAEELLDVGVRAVAARGDVAVSSDVQQATQAVLAAEARLDEERGARFPSVEAAAGLLDYGTLSGRHTFEWQAGVQVSWPIFTGGARSAAMSRAAADLNAAERDLDVTVLHVAQALDAAETSVLEADARAEALGLAVTQWEEVARIEALALEVGSGVQHDLLRAEAGLFSARAGYATARYDAIVARARLARAEGRLDRRWVTDSLEIL